MFDVSSLPKRFRIIRRLGEGGMGVVYEAHDEERGARVALKTISNLNPVSLSRFKREFRAVADVQHPNLVSLGELIFEGATWFFTMELVEGCDFLEYVRPLLAPGRPISGASEPPPTLSVAPAPASSDRAIALAPTIARSRPSEAGFDELRLRSALRQLALALEALHAGGIAHRDIKPANIRVTGSGRVVLLDFGLAEDFTREGSLTQARMAGTPAYMAPEQAASGAVGPAADWYAIGVLLYEAMTGALPFEGAPLAMMMEKQQDGPAPSARLPSAPTDLDALCVRLLRFNPNARPTGADVLRALEGDPASARRLQPSSVTNAAPFVGRAAELAALREAFVESRTVAVTVLIEGESGVGKSSLVRAFVETLGHEVRDLVVLAGRCYEREAVPYKAFDGVVDALTRFLVRERAAAGGFLPTRAGPLAQVFPVLRRVEAFASATQKLALDPLEIRSRAFSGMRDMLVRLGEKRALIVMIDDMQWADTDSLALLAEVLRPPDAPTMLLLATARASTLGGEATFQAKAAILRDLGRLPGDVRHVPLSRLPDDEARELAAGLLQRAGGPSGGAGVHAGKSGDTPSAETIAREAGGHPFFIDALVRHATLTRAVGAGGLQEALWSSVASLEPAARRLMELIAVAPAPVTQEALAAAADIAPEALGRPLARLRVGHLISVTGVRSSDTAEPYHDRLRAAVLAHLDPATLAELHGALASALERTGSPDVEALAVHWSGAGNAKRAAEYAAKAADAAANALAFDQAARLYEATLDFGQHDGAERRQLLEKFGDALANAGRGRRAAAAYAEAATGAQAAQSLDLQRRGADQLLRAGHFDEGLAAIHRVLAAFGIALPASPLSAVVFCLAYRGYVRLRGLRFRSRDESQVLATDLTRIDVCWSVAFGLGLVDTVTGAAFNARNLVLALRSGERRRIARAIATEAAFVSCGGGRTIRRTEALLQRAHALAIESGALHAIGWAHCASGIACYLSGRWKKALEHMDRAKAAWIDVPGAVYELDSATFFSTNTLAQLGNIGRLVREVPKAVADARQRGDLYAAVNLRISLANLAWLAVDDVVAATAQIDEAMSEWSKRGFHVEHYYELLSRTDALVYSGRAREAYANITTRWLALRRSLLPLTIQSVRIHSLHARARSAIATAEEGRPDGPSLLRDAAAAARRIEREQMAWAAPWAKLLRAGIAMVAKRESTAASLLREAISDFDGVDMALYAAASRRCLGALLGGDEGRELVRAADAWMTSETIKSPARMTAMLAPGFGRLRG